MRQEGRALKLVVLQVWCLRLGNAPSLREMAPSRLTSESLGGFSSTSSAGSAKGVHRFGPPLPTTMGSLRVQPVWPASQQSRR